jgi:L-malate glycosyltransferase
VLKLCYVANAKNIHVRRWLAYFVSRKYTVYCLSDKGGEMEGVTVIQLPNRDSLLQSGKRAGKMAVLKARAKAIRQFAKHHNVDVFHAIFLYHRGWSAALAGLHPMVITLLGSDVYLPRQQYRNLFHYWRDVLLNKLSLGQCDLITAVSEDLINRVRSHQNQQVPIELVPIGTDLTLFKPDIDTTSLKQQLNIPANSFVVLSPRQITPHYNQHTLIESIPDVLDNIPNAIFIFKDAFCDTAERQEYVAQLKQQADMLNVSHATRWVGEVPMEQLPQYYALCDVVVSIPKTDGMPVTIFEAMACRKPLIVSDLSSYNQVIIHGQTGLRVPLNNSAVLSIVIRKIYDNPALTERLVDESQVILYQYGVFTEQMRRMDHYYNGLGTGSLSLQNRFFNQLLKRINYGVLHFISWFL